MSADRRHWSDAPGRTGASRTGTGPWGSLRLCHASHCVTCTAQRAATSPSRSLAGDGIQGFGPPRDRRPDGHAITPTTAAPIRVTTINDHGKDRLPIPTSRNADNRDGQSAAQDNPQQRTEDGDQHRPR